MESAHFQLTRRCNLHCRFCGQSRGMVGSAAVELPEDFWLRAASECRSVFAAPPRLTLWGGEPLLYPKFDRLAEKLFRNGFELSIVTNGTLIADHAEVLNDCFSTIFVSVDGPEPIHDAIRGGGVFAKLRENLPLLKKRRGKMIFLTTVSDANAEELPRIPEQLAPLGCDAIIFQQLMYLSAAEIAAYRDYSRRVFGCDYPELEVWKRDDDASYLAKLRRGLAALKQIHPSVPVRFTAHRYPDNFADDRPCLAAERRIHLRNDGEVGFCTDYFGFSAGNLREHSLKEILSGERAGLFRRAVREGRLPVCDHCPWRRQLSAAPEPVS